MEPAPDPAPRAARRAPVTYFRVICRRGVLLLAVGEAIGAEPSGCVESAAARVEGARLPSSTPLLRPPFPPWDVCAERLERCGGGGGCTFRVEAGPGLWRCRSSLRDRLTEGVKEGGNPGLPSCAGGEALRFPASPGRAGRGSPETASGPSALTGPRGARPPKAASGPAAPTWPCAAGVGQLGGRKQERGRPPLGVRSAFPGPKCPRRSRRPSS